MGVAYSVRCECGYQEDELADGCGMAMQSYVIVLCKKCRRLSSKYIGLVGNTETISNKRCGHCRCGGIELYSASESDNNKCPCCGKQSLVFTSTLCWD